MEQSFRINSMHSPLSIGGSHFTTVEPGWSYEMHNHIGYELLYCHSGTFIEWIHGESIEMKSGDWLLIGPGVNHSTINVSKEALAYFSMHFDIEDIEARNELKHMNFVHLQGPFTTLDTLFNNLQREVDNSPRTTGRLTMMPELVIQSIIFQLLHEIMQWISLPNDRIILNNKLLKIEIIELANTIERRLQGAMDTTITINEVARELFISRSHCNEVFKKVYGIAPRQYLSHLKLKKAEALIMHSGLSIEAISEKLGFSCLGSFSRQFSRWTGLAPVQFKKMRSKL